jgi:hypothetical protein
MIEKKPTVIECGKFCNVTWLGWDWKLDKRTYQRVLSELGNAAIQFAPAPRLEPGLFE